MYMFMANIYKFKTNVYEFKTTTYKSKSYYFQSRWLKSITGTHKFGMNSGKDVTIDPFPEYDNDSSS